MHRINKLIPIAIIFLTFCKNVYAQQEQIQDSLIVDDQVSSTYQYLDVNDFEQKLILKISQPLGDNYNQYDASSVFTTPGKISLETKLTPSFSIEGGYIFSDLTQQGVFGDIRYYFNKSRNSGGVNNFVGSHLMFGLNGFFGQNENINYCPDLRTNIFHVGAGYQGKVGRYGYYNTTALFNYDQSRQSIYFSLGADVGFGYGRLRKPLYYENERQSTPLLMNKSGILKISDLQFYYGENQRGLGLSIGYEARLFRNVTLSGFIKARAFQGMKNYSSNGEIMKYSSSRLSSDLELKYYYNQKSRLMRGKDGSSFNGPYIMMAVNDFYDSHDYRYSLAPTSFKDSFFSQSIYKLAWGYQQLIGKRGFIDFNIGPGYSHQDGFSIYSNVKIGLRF